ncbi:hypothetical protein KEM52_005623 [Ascosphaera acerosa]|nr:hypothetical protein KEM52_005623 [Ascosphaera acerosa]
MDFWSRLIGGGAPGPRTSRARSTAERLTAFKRLCANLHHIWRTSPREDLRNAGLAAHVRTCFDRLSGILRDEAKTPAPHPCQTYSATARIYLTVGGLALLTDHPGVIASAGSLFNILIESEADGIVDNRGFARTLVDLVSYAATIGAEGQGRLVELLFGVANNIRSRPEILSAWFHPQKPLSRVADDDDDDERERKDEQRFAGATRKDDFAFFYLLVDYVHHAGRTGDFARTGLLYIIETATKSKELEQWLVESDLATLMATGLGALYSQLSRKLTYCAADDDRAPAAVIQHSDHAAVASAQPPHLEHDMDAFLSYLLFWQDTLEHCKSVDVNKTLLDHFQVLFLQQLLYPSLLESSDVDGGSTSAVLTYLARILESLDQPDLVHRVLHFLLASPLDDADDDGGNAGGGSHSSPARPREGGGGEGLLAPPPPPSYARRLSCDVISDADAASPELFDLVDICLMGIRSENMQTVVATLRLMTVIVDRHHAVASSFVKTLDDRDELATQRCVGALNAEIQQFMSLATTIVDEPRIDHLYGNYLADATAVLEVRNMELPLYNKDLLPAKYSKYPLRVDPQDELLEGIVDLLENFFTNSTVLNLALTDAVSGLASSNLISLDGWLLVDPQYYQFPDEKEPDAEEFGDEMGMGGTADEDGLNVNRAIAQLQRVYVQPFWAKKHVPPITKVIRSLVRQVAHWREEIPDFDILIAARKKLLQEEETQAARARQPTRATEKQQRQPRWSADLTLKAMKELTLDTAAAAAASVTSGNGGGTASPATTRVASEASTRCATPAGGVVAEDILSRLNKPFLKKNPPRATLSAGAARAKGLRSRVNTLLSLPQFSSNADHSRPVSRDRSHDADQPSTGAGEVRLRARSTIATATADQALDATRASQASSEQPSTPTAPPVTVPPPPPREEKPATLGHVLTNTILLHEFILELTALIQMRASLFQEVSFRR